MVIQQPGLVLGFLIFGILMGGLIVAEMSWFARVIDQAKCQATIESLKK